MNPFQGPFRFRLVRKVDETGISGTGHVADGVCFEDGTCVLRWRTRHRSTASYESIDDLIAIHGHDGKTTVEWTDEPPSASFRHGWTNCVQDRCENCPFASIGGLEHRNNPKVPDYAKDRDEWLAGYLAAAEAMYGPDWRTCSFGWAPALTIP